jgi:hypothetical protein
MDKDYRTDGEIGRDYSADTLRLALRSQLVQEGLGLPRGTDDEARTAGQGRLRQSGCPGSIGEVDNHVWRQLRHQRGIVAHG